MIPAFSVGRTQELLFHLGTMAAAGQPRDSSNRNQAVAVFSVREVLFRKQDEHSQMGPVDDNYVGTVPQIPPLLSLSPLTLSPLTS